MILFCRSILRCIDSIRISLLPPWVIVCSMCAFDKNPKIPIDVMNIKITTANVRYDFNSTGIHLQLICNHDAATSLPTSKAPPIIAMGSAAPANIAIRPAILYHAAIPAIMIDVRKRIYAINHIYSATIPIFLRSSCSPDMVKRRPSPISTVICFHSLRMPFL